MMRVGLDLVEVEEVELALSSLGERYRRRLFSPDEIRQSEASADPAGCLAELFAAKEATLKVLGAADRGVDWRSVQCRPKDEAAGAGGGTGVVAHLSGRARLAARDAGISGIKLSLSRDGGHAMALAVAWGGPDRAQGEEPD